MEPDELVARLHGWDTGRGHPSTRLSAALAAAIEDGRVPLGTRLPAERSLASNLGVSRGTVVRAYASLRERDRAYTRQGSGTYAGRSDDRPGRSSQLAGMLSAEGTGALTERDAGAIDLRLATRLGERDTLQAMRRWQPADLTDVGLDDNGYWPLGLPALRHAIAARLTDHGLPTTPDQLIVTNGAQQALDLVLTTFATHQDTVLIPEVTWPGLVELLAIRGLRPLTIPLAADHQLDQVALVGQLREGRSPLACLVPTFDNPTGAVMPGPTRRLVVEAAREGGTVLVDDLALAELWLDDHPPPPLAAVVPGGAPHVVTVGSLSKLAWGGLRIGWLRAEAPLFDRLARVKTALDLGNSVPSQLAAVSVMRHLDDLVTAHRAELRSRREAMTAALTTHLPSWRFRPPAGGMSVWVDLGGVPGDSFANTAARYGVRLSPGRVYHALGHDTGHVRLPLTHDIDTTNEAIRRLADAWADHLGQRRGRRIALV